MKMLAKKIELILIIYAMLQIKKKIIMIKVYGDFVNSNCIFFFFVLLFYFNNNNHYKKKENHLQQNDDENYKFGTN